MKATSVLDSGSNLNPEIVERVEALYQEKANKKSKYTHDELLKALYWFHDFMERPMIKYFLVGSTAESALKNGMLEGDKVEVGVRRLEWISGGSRIAENFAVADSKTDDLCIYVSDGVPIHVNIFDDIQEILSCDTRLYEHEYFFIPNPYNSFKQIWSK